MSEIKRTFLQGKMNKDLDERIVPEGQYVDALNIQIAKSEGSDVGSIENSLGNEQKTFFNLTNSRTIGTYVDHSNQTIYYFNTADEKDLVVEYDDKNEMATVLLESTRVNGKTLLDFQKDKLITGVVKIISGKYGEDLLAWTDDNSSPRIINIERAKGYGVDGFEEDDISLIKKPPLYAPKAKLTYVEDGIESDISDKFLSFAYSYRYIDGEMSALSPFTNAAFSPKKFQVDYQTYENEGMTNAFSAVDIEFNTGSKRVVDIMLVYKESNSSTVYVIDTFNKKDHVWGNHETRSFRFSNSKIYRLLDENELLRTFDSVPRKAKALDVIGNRLAFGNYLEGYSLKDAFGERLKLDYNLSLFTKNLEGSEVKYSLFTINKENDLITFDFSNISLILNSRLSFGIHLGEKTDGSGTYSGDLDFILNKPHGNAVDLAEDADFIQFIESVFTDDFMQNYSYTPPDNSELIESVGFVIDSYTTTSISIKAPILTYEVDNTPEDSTDSNFSTHISYWGYEPQTATFFKDTAIDSSCKTNRSYEVAMVYLDEYGRATTALTSPYNTLYIPQENSVYKNKIRVNINHKPPVWAKYFRFALKQNKKEYQTIYPTVFYEDGLFRWMKLDGGNKDKVKEGDVLTLKSDLGGVLSDIIKVRVLEISTKEENFLSGNSTVAGDEIVEQAGLYMKIKPSGFDMNFNGDTLRTFEGGSHLRYPKNTYTDPYFGTTKDGVFSPFELNLGSQVRIFIMFKAKGSIAYEAVYDKRLPVNDDYNSVKEWFEAEVKDLGAFGNDFTRGWGFTADGSQFYARAHRDGTASRKITTTVKFEIFATEGIMVFETEPEDALTDVFYEGSQTFEVIDGDLHEGNIQTQDVLHPSIIELDFFNCYALGSGVESYRYKDALNEKYLNFDSRPTAKSESEYREIRRYADITYSEPYVESLGINGLNNFNAAKANYKDDIVKKYGSIQKILARDTDLVVFQEDRVSKVLYGKELIVGPDGDSNIASTENILGSQIMYAGEHGVSRNPESIAMSGNQIWFTDEKRNHVCRLSQDGITVISNYGMTSFFREQFAAHMNNAKLGAYDPYHGKYTLSATGITIYNPIISFDCSQSIKKQDFKGSFKAEIDFGLSTGEVGVNISTDKNLNVALVWNGNRYESLITGVGNITFNKTDMLPITADLIVETGDEKTTFEVQGNCAVVEEFTVISIIKAGTSDVDQVIDNRYKWILDSYSSSYKHFREKLKEGVTLFHKETGKEGVDFIPKSGSQVLIESFKGYNDSGTFDSGDSLGYLISDMEYSEADIDTILAEATIVSPEPVVTEGGEVIHKVLFDLVRPFDEKFLYLIYDYSYEEAVEEPAPAPEPDPDPDPSLSSYSLSSGADAQTACSGQYLDGYWMDGDLNISTVLYTDPEGTTLAAQGFYSNSTDVREWSGSVWVNPAETCPI